LGPNLGARSGAHALAVSVCYRCASHRTATACDGGRVVRSNAGNVAAIGHGAPLRACEGTAGTLARCLRSWLGCGYTAPSPPAMQMRCRLAGVSKPRSRIWYASLTAPRNDSPPPLLRPLRRSLSARGFATCRPSSSCHLLRRVAHVRVCAAYSQWSSVSGEHPPRRLARQTSPAAAVTSPRIVINYKKNRYLCGLRLVLGLFLRVLLVIFRNRKTPRFVACSKNRGALPVKP
jgi:hypothetical protein